MLNEKVYQDMNRAIKTGNVLKELAKIEVTQNRIFTDAEIERIIYECFIDTITRKDIDFEKVLFNSIEYQNSLEKLNNILDLVKEKKVEYNDDTKEKVLEIVKIKDSIYNRLKDEFYK